MKLTQIGTQKLHKLKKSENITLWFSYKEPIILKMNGTLYVRATTFSRTTSSHRNQIINTEEYSDRKMLKDTDFFDMIKLYV